jgi:hypothetical protein
MLWESLRGAETAIRIRPTTDLRLYTWGLRFLRECTADRAKRNTLIKLRLCQYSQAVMNELVRAEQIEYHAIAKGALYLYRDAAELDAGVKKMALWPSTARSRRSSTRAASPSSTRSSSRCRARSPARSATSATRAATRVSSSRISRACVARSSASW